MLISGIFVLLMAARGAECGCAGSKPAVEGSIEAYQDDADILCAEKTNKKACEDSRSESYTHEFNCVWSNGECKARSTRQYYKYTAK
uniref:Uncharacterized protein n=1 Tax=Globodera rostochiensis TaxID=31243 RepID=A0A914I426_GLORO